MNQTNLRLSVLAEAIDEVLASGWLKFLDPETGVFTDLPDPENPWMNADQYAQLYGYSGWQQMADTLLPLSAIQLPDCFELRDQYDGIDRNPDLQVQAALDWCRKNRLVFEMDCDQPAEADAQEQKNVSETEFSSAGSGIRLKELMYALEEILYSGWLRYWDPATDSYTDLPDPANPLCDGNGLIRSYGFDSFEDMKSSRISPDALRLPDMQELSAEYPGIWQQPELLKQAATDWCTRNGISFQSDDSRDQESMAENPSAVPEDAFCYNRCREVQSMYDTFLFDLDGTITESAPGITRSVAYALNKRGIQADLKDLEVFVGPPLADSFRKFYGIEDTAAAIADYREYYEKQGMFENSVYPGVREMLKKLQKDGKHLFLATSKPQQYARQILKHFDLDSFFEGVYGASMDEKLVNKDEIIALCRKDHPYPDAVMVGDREHDIFGGKKNGLDTIGVLYGYGSRKELESAGADHICEKAEDILRYS